MQAPENGSQGTPGRQCAQFAVGCLPTPDKILLGNYTMVMFEHRFSPKYKSYIYIKIKTILLELELPINVISILPQPHVLRKLTTNTSTAIALRIGVSRTVRRCLALTNW